MRGETISTVLNLITGEEQTFTLSPAEALISAAILADKRAGDLTNPFVRERYAKKILVAKISMSIGDLAVRY